MRTDTVIKKYLSLLILFALFFSGCAKAGTPSVVHVKEAAYPDNTDAWTVMLYLCGSDLETIDGSATESIKEILNANQADGINVVIETGGAESWWTKGIESDCLQRFHVQKHKLLEDQVLESNSMGDSSTLSSFIQWSSEHYPAEKYMLILWDHGGGSADGLCIDELYSDRLHLNELRDAMVKANLPMEVIGIDACLMASLETAEALQGYAHYMVASEETEPGWGWDYTAIMNKLSADPGCDGKTIGTEIVDSYFRKLEKHKEGPSQTLSLTDLTKIPVLSAAFRELSSELVLSTQDVDRIRAVSQGARKTESYGSNSDSTGYTNMVDLGNLLDNTKDSLTSAVKVKDALKSAVVYEKHGEYRSRASGLSVLYPLSSSQHLVDSYAAFSDNAAYIKYISIVGNEYDSEEWVNAWMDQLKEKVKPGAYDSYFDSGIGDEGYSYTYDKETLQGLQNLTPVTEKDYTITYMTSVDEDGFFRMNITSGLEAVDYVYYMIFQDLGDEGYVVLGTDSDIYADYKTGEFSDHFRGLWFGFDDQLVYADLMEDTEGYALYSIPVFYKEKDWTVRAAYNYKEGTYSVLGMYQRSDEKTGMASKTARKLQFGDHLELVFPIYSWDENSDYDGEYILGEINWGFNTKFNEVPLEDGDYYYMFVIEDIFGNKHYSDTAIIEVDGDSIWCYETE